MTTQHCEPFTFHPNHIIRDRLTKLLKDVHYSAPFVDHMVTRATLPHTYEEMGEEIYRGLTRVKDIPGIDYCEFIKVYEKLAKNLPRLARALTKKHCNCDTKKLFREIVLQLTHSR